MDSTVYHGSAYTVVRSTSQSDGDSKISGEQNSKTSKPIEKKFGVGDYIIDERPHAKTMAPLAAWRHMCEISPLHGFYHATLC